MLGGCLLPLLVVGPHVQPLAAKAVARDSGFALAYAGIGIAHAALADAYVAPLEAYPLARDAALAALELDSLVADAHGILGFSEAILTSDIERGTRQLRRALDLDPNAVYPRFLLGILYCFRRQTGDGLALTERALQLDPLSELMLWGKQFCLTNARRWDDVIAALQESSASSPEDSGGQQ